MEDRVVLLWLYVYLLQNGDLEYDQQREDCVGTSFNVIALRCNQSHPTLYQEEKECNIHHCVMYLYTLVHLQIHNTII